MVSEDDLGPLKESIQELLTQECDSLTLHRFYDGQNDLDRQLWAHAAELGWLAIGLPEEQGGLGMGVQGLDVLFRELGAAGAPGGFIPTLVGAQWLAETVAEAADASSGEEILAGVISGELELATPATPDADAGGKVEERGGRLNGRSSWLLGSAGAGLAIMPVTREQGAAFALVRLGRDGARFETRELWDKTRQVGAVVCENAEPLALIDDAEGTLGARYFEYLSLAIAADCIGAGNRIAMQTIEYLKGREQFGRPLASFQALKHRSVNLLVALTPADYLLMHAVEETARGSSNGRMYAALAKAAAADAFRFVADDCVQLHGGVGHTWEFDAHIFLKRSLLNEILAGQSNQLRDTAAGDLERATRAGVSTMEIAA